MRTSIDPDEEGFPTNKLTMHALMRGDEMPVQVVPAIVVDETAPATDGAFVQAAATRPVLIAVPLYRRPELARQVVGSLLRCADEIAEIGGEVLLFNDSPDDLELAEALDDLVGQAVGVLPLRVARNPENLGFVRTCNQAFREAVARGMDLLLLNSDTVVAPGALAEMARVSRLDPMIGFVNPRSNNATLATLPYQDRFRNQPPAEARAAWAAVADHLPPMSYVPTAVGFCMWIRWPVMAEFGGFDEIYGRGYNEENDLVMRAGRRGYRAVLANHAFVWHEGQGSFHDRPETRLLEAENRSKLLARYPEYARLTEVYFCSPEQRAEVLLGGLVPGPDGRVDVALDFSSFVTARNGTTEAGAQLLAGALKRWSERFSLHVLCTREAYDFHGYARFGVPRCDPHGPETFAAIFRVGQPYDWSVNERLAMKAATFGVAMLDTISLDCTQLSSPRLYGMWNFVAEHADLITGISDLSLAQLERRFHIGADVLRLSSLLSLDLADYAPPEGEANDVMAAPGYLFVVGNHFWHKDVAATVRALAEALPGRRIVVLGAADKAASPPVDGGVHAPRGLEALPNVLRLQAGGLTPQQMGALYANAAAVVFPSHYEGFGMPVLNALAVRRPVFVRPLPVFEEMARALGGEANLHVFASIEDLVATLRDPPAWTAEGASPGRVGDAERVAEEIGVALEAAMAKVSYARIVKRIRAIQTLHDFANIRVGDISHPTDRASLAAHHAGLMVEARLRPLLAAPGLFAAARLVYRAARATRRLVRRQSATA